MDERRHRLQQSGEMERAALQLLFAETARRIYRDKVVIGSLTKLVLPQELGATSVNDDEVFLLEARRGGGFMRFPLYREWESAQRAVDHKVAAIADANAWLHVDSQRRRQAVLEMAQDRSWELRDGYRPEDAAVPSHQMPASLTSIAPMAFEKRREIDEAKLATAMQMERRFREHPHKDELDRAARRCGPRPDLQDYVSSLRGPHDVDEASFDESRAKLTYDLALLCQSVLERSPSQIDELVQRLGDIGATDRSTDLLRLRLRENYGWSASMCRCTATFLADAYGAQRQGGRSTVAGALEFQGESLAVVATFTGKRITLSTGRHAERALELAASNAISS